jgi:cytoskeletal protein RodZ
MSKDFFPEIGKGKPANGAKGSSQQLLLILLLVLAALIGYLYFFTGLIKPREQVTTTAPVRAIPVKRPLPPRPDQGDEKQASAARPEEKQPPQAITERPAPPPAPTRAKPVAAPTAKPVAAPTAKPAAAPSAKPAAAPAQQPYAKAERTEAKPVKVVQARTAAPAPSAKPGQEAGTKPAGAARQTMKQGAYTLAVGEYANERELQRARAKLEKLGIAQVDTQKIKKPVIMHRLFLAEFDNHKSADAELRKLQQVTGSAFILEEKGRYAVYGGSYLHERGAVTEQKRLAGKGVKLGIKTVNVMIQISKLTAGSFPSDEEARKEAHRLEKQGIVAQVIKVGK